MPEGQPYKVIRIDELETKRKIRGAIRKAKTVQLFIHSDYFELEREQDTPRHKVTIQYALEFIDAVPEDKLPFLGVLSEDPLVYLLIPNAWEDQLDKLME